MFLPALRARVAGRTGGRREGESVAFGLAFAGIGAAALGDVQIRHAARETLIIRNTGGIITQSAVGGHPARGRAHKSAGRFRMAENDPVPVLSAFHDLFHLSVGAPAAGRVDRLDTAADTGIAGRIKGGVGIAGRRDTGGIDVRFRAAPALGLGFGVA